MWLRNVLVSNHGNGMLSNNKTCQVVVVTLTMSVCLCVRVKSADHYINNEIWSLIGSATTGDLKSKL